MSTEAHPVSRLIVKSLRGVPAEERFWTKVLTVESCWEWIGGRDSWGYGVFYDGNRHVGAHRYAYELRRGPIPAGLTIDHLCRNKGCVNPDHMEPVTMRENTLRSSNACGVNSRKKLCINGHDDWAPRSKTGERSGRYCRTCNNKGQLARYYRRKSSSQ